VKYKDEDMMEGVGWVWAEEVEKLKKQSFSF